MREKQDLVRHYILGGVASGHLRAGQRLPPERELAQRFGTTRAAVRQALLVLESERCVTRHVGRGTFVTEGALPRRARHPRDGTTGGDASVEVGPAELLQARQLLEPHVVELVVLNASVSDLVHISQILDAQERLADAGEFEASDTMFHMALARATHNDVIIAVGGIIAHARQGPEWCKIKQVVAQRLGGPRRAAIDEHKRILEAVSARDAVAAVRAMRVHLEQVRVHLLGL